MSPLISLLYKQTVFHHAISMLMALTNPDHISCLLQTEMIAQLLLQRIIQSLQKWASTVSYPECMGQAQEQGMPTYNQGGAMQSLTFWPHHQTSLTLQSDQAPSILDQGSSPSKVRRQSSGCFLANPSAASGQLCWDSVLSPDLLSGSLSCLFNGKVRIQQKLWIQVLTLPLHGCVHQFSMMGEKLLLIEQNIFPLPFTCGQAGSRYLWPL